MATTGVKQDRRADAGDLFTQGRWQEAAQLLSEQMSAGETAELWNDWGAIQVSAGQILDAERAFRRALRCDVTFTPASENLGALLYAQRRMEEAGTFLRLALRGAPEEHRGQLVGMLEKCPLLGTGEKTASVGQAAAPIVERPAIGSGTSSNQDGLVAPKSADYEDWFAATFRQRVPAPGPRIAVSWPEDSVWGRRAFNALIQVECDFAKELLLELKNKNVPGDLAEFGIFEGWWVRFLDEATENIGLQRRVYGFDSFAGLSQPHPEFDMEYWAEGQYACSYEQVAKNISLITRPRVKLVKGFFEKSLHEADARLAEQFCYVRIDCDIYEPALECLNYLGPRLADGAILIFDDWPHVRGFGEQRAFEEWLPSVPHLEFEFLFYGVIGHFYMRVRHKK